MNGPLDILLRGAVGVYTREELKKKLDGGRTLRVKLGVDPTAPDIHLGHTVVLRKLRQFQELGHQAVLIIGDATAMIGDPSGRSKTRPVLTHAEVEACAKTYFDQIGRVLDLKKLEVHRNSEWLKPLTFMEIVQLAGKLTVARLIERDDFGRRLKDGVPVGLHEFLYVLMQSYDSVAVKADVELGGTDQTFNLVTARDFMRDFGMEPQVALTTPLLRGLDGAQKMSKSYGNYVGVAEDAMTMYSKVMSIPDAVMEEYYTLLTDVAFDAAAHPMDSKKHLALEVTKAYHPKSTAEGAALEWVKVFSQKSAPTEIPLLRVDPGDLKDGRVWIVKLIVKTGLAKSNGEARRLIEQGGVELDDARLTDPALEFEPREGQVLKIGKKRKHFRLHLS